MVLIVLVLLQSSVYCGYGVEILVPECILKICVS